MASFQDKVLNINDNNKHQPSKGQKIMALAEVLRPELLKKLGSCKDEHGMPVAPARIRGLALVIAQELVNAEQAA